MKKILAFIIISILVFVGCGRGEEPSSDAASVTSIPAVEKATSDPAVEKTGDIMILYTSDVHCGIDKGFGYEGLAQIRESYEEQGYTTILVDNGDAIQGEPIGLLSRGESIIEIMNALKYDVATPGNHDFDYEVDRFMELTELADFPYISCNFNKEGELLFEPYKIIEAEGKKIAFVGITTPETLVTSTPAYFQDENGEFIYGFLQGGDGEELYNAVQAAVDAARDEGADYVYALGHLGMNAVNEPWTYADVIANTSGIDVFFDGHSHDTEQVEMKNKDGETVVRSACGTKLTCIGYSHITADGEIKDTGVWSWPNGESPSTLFGIKNEISNIVEEKLAELDKEISKVVANTDVELTIYDPEAKDNMGNPVRMVRRAETNLGDLCADSIKDATGAEIALVNGGGVRTSIAVGEITYKNIIDVMPFNNQVCVINATGQQIADALEWGARSLPDENGAFLQVAGLSYEVDVNVASPCKVSKDGMMEGIEGERRVKNVKVNGEPIDLKKSYTVSGADYVLLGHGDGLTAFDGAEVVSQNIYVDSEATIKYITETLGGKIGDAYKNPYGEGRIIIMD